MMDDVHIKELADITNTLKNRESIALKSGYVDLMAETAALLYEAKIIKDVAVRLNQLMKHVGDEAMDMYLGTVMDQQTITAPKILEAACGAVGETLSLMKEIGFSHEPYSTNKTEQTENVIQFPNEETEK